LRIYNKYILSLGLVSCLINPLLALSGQNDLIIYFAVNIFAYLAITLFYVHLNPVVRRALNRVAAVFFAGFFVIVVFKTMEILSVR
jgi:hypothetical protein